MCLVTNRKTPIKAKHDIYVVKQLSGNAKDGFRAPCQNTAYKLNELKEAEGTDCSKVTEKSKREIGAGYIHAHTTITGDKSNKVGYLAYIPAGTEFYIDDDFENVCAKSLFVTDQLVDDGGKAATDENHRNIAEAMLDAYLDDETKVGYYVMPDKSLVSPRDLTKEQGEKAIAIVVNYNKETGERLAWALTEKKLPYCDGNDKFLNVGIRVDYDCNLKAFRTFKDTEKCMKAVIDSKEYKEEPDAFPAFKYVHEFKTEGTKAGDWNMDAPGVLFEVVMDDMTVANAAMLFTGVGTLIYGWYWASAERSQGLAWSCNTNYASVYYNGKWYSFQVRPSLALAAQTAQPTARKRPFLSRLFGA